MEFYGVAGLVRPWPEIGPGSGGAPQGSVRRTNWVLRIPRLEVKNVGQA